MPLLTLYGHINTTEQQPTNSNTVISTLAVDGWVVTFGTASEEGPERAQM